MKEVERVELHLHTKLSDDVSVIEPAEAIRYADIQSHKAVAFTNLNNVQDFPVIAEAYEKYADSDIKVIYGAEVRYMSENGKSQYGITILVRNQAGVKELYRIISSMRSDGEFDNLVSLDVVKRNRENLLIGSCGNVGELYELVANGADLEHTASFYDYFEIYPAGDEEEREVNKKIYELGIRCGIPVVAAGNCHYLRREDEIVRRVIRVAQGHKSDNQNLFYHTTEEMLDEFSFLGEEGAYNAVVVNTNRISEIIMQITPVTKESYPLLIPNAYDKIQELVHSKAKDMYGECIPQQIAARLETELDFIKRHRFASYYWIAYRMISHMNELGYYVGSRGSVGSVLTAFLLGITDTNPLPAHYYCHQCYYIDFEVSELDGFDLPDQVCPVCGCQLKSDGHNIPFETFMGIDGSKFPDIDLIFPASMAYNEHSFIQELLGEDNVVHGGTIATLSWQTACEYIAAYENETNDCFTEEQRNIICEKICGIKRDDGIHPGKIIVLPQGMDFEDIVPIKECKSDSPIRTATHFSYHYIHNIIFDMDVLAHNDLDMLKMLEERSGKPITSVKWNDSEVYALFNSANTMGITEFSTDTMRNRILKTMPESFADLVKIYGLEHGTGIWKDNVDCLMVEGHRLSEIPAFRDDVMLQLIQYGLERERAYQIAEHVRIGKLSHDSRLSLEFIETMRNFNVPEWYIQCLRKIQYMFPKAHAVSYVMNAVRMAGYKVHCPNEFNRELRNRS